MNDNNFIEKLIQCPFCNSHSQFVERDEEGMYTTYICQGIDCGAEIWFEANAHGDIVMKAREP